MSFPLRLVILTSLQRARARKSSIDAGSKMMNAEFHSFCFVLSLETHSSELLTLIYMISANRAFWV